MQHNVYSYVTDETTIYQEILAGYFKNLYARIANLPGSASWDITVRKNGADTALAVNIDNSGLSSSDTTNSIPVSDGDNVSVEITPISGPATTSFIKWSVVHISGEILPSRAITRITGVRHLYNAFAMPQETYNNIAILGGISAFSTSVRGGKFPGGEGGIGGFVDDEAAWDDFLWWESQGLA